MPEISKAMLDALNEQIRNEMYSSYVYLSMSAHFERANLKGFAKWMRMQSQEEMAHAMKIFDFINYRDGHVTLLPIDQPPASFPSHLKTFETALEHERRVTGMINRLYALAQKESDYATQVMLHWFIKEQVEEEKNASEIVERLRLAGNEGAGLLLLDKELGERKSE